MGRLRGGRQEGRGRDGTGIGFRSMAGGNEDVGEANAEEVAWVDQVSCVGDGREGATGQGPRLGGEHGLAGRIEGLQEFCLHGGVGSLCGCALPPPLKGGWASFVGVQRWVWWALREL